LRTGDNESRKKPLSESQVIDPSEDTFGRLTVRAAVLNICVDDLFQPVIDGLADDGASTLEQPGPLTGDSWWADLEAWKRHAESRAGRCPPGFVLDESRESIYRGRDDTQL
jgi:hypothetical protein